MQLRHLGANQATLETSKATILFSYNTPVAAFISGRGWVRTETYYSKTTTRHINSWVDGVRVETVPQSFLDTLLDEGN